MSFAAVRAHIETKVFTAFQNLEPPLEVVFQNTMETPPSLPYVRCIVSYSNVTLPVICNDDGNIEQINGNLQLSVYAPRARGMKALEQWSGEAMKVMNNLYERAPDAPVRVRGGQINGPRSILEGDQPYAVATVSCSFLACVD